jgi:hypothetical protein
MTRPWSTVQVKQWSKHDSKKPKDQTREDENSEHPVRKLPNLVGQGASSNPKRNWRQGPTRRSEKTLEDSGPTPDKGGRWLGWSGPKPAGPARLAQPISWPSQPLPFDLTAIRAIYSLEARSHASTHSSSAAEKQRREGHHLGEERVKLVD